MDKRVVLVTGASRGIGAATAVALARGGAHVVLTARTEGGLGDTDDAVRAAGGTATLLPLDLMQGDQIDMIGRSVLQRFGRLDGLVHAAGTLGRLTPVHDLQPRDWADAVGVNLAGAWRLIRTCAPLLLAAEAGRAVFVTCEAATEPRAYWGAYGATKAGLEHLVRCWAAEVATTRLRVNLFDPGVVVTRLRREAMPGEDAAALARPEDVAPGIAALCDVGETRHGARVERHHAD